MKTCGQMGGRQGQADQLFGRIPAAGVGPATGVSAKVISHEVAALQHERTAEAERM